MGASCEMTEATRAGSLQPPYCHLRICASAPSSSPFLCTTDFPAGNSFFPSPTCSFLPFVVLFLEEYPHLQPGPLHGCLAALLCSSSVAQWYRPTWTVARQAPLFMGFSSQEYWCALPFPSPGDLCYPMTRTRISCTAGRFFNTAPPRKPALTP